MYHYGTVEIVVDVKMCVRRWLFPCDDDDDDFLFSMDNNKVEFQNVRRTVSCRVKPKI